MWQRKPLEFEIQVHFRIERARQIALDHHAAEAALAARLHARTVLLAPVERQPSPGSVAALPGDGQAAIGHRQRAETGGVGGELMQREPKILRRLRLERDRRTADRHLLVRVRDMDAELRAHQFVERGAMPALAHQ